MKTVEINSFCENLDGFFEKYHPSSILKKLNSLIKFLENSSKVESIEFNEMGLLYDLKKAFTSALKREGITLLMANEEEKYEVNLFPLIDFIKDNPILVAELNILRSTLMTLINENNIIDVKEHYRFVNLLSYSFDIVL